MVHSTILSRRMIKPSSPTPSSFRRHNLSFIDHMNTLAYIPIATFYSKPANLLDEEAASQISQILENSLSKVLASYYPIAGTINTEDKYVDCNDMGAEFLNVQVSCPMSEILNNNDIATDVVFPKDLPWSSSLDKSPLVVQLSHFSCGGIAVSMCVSHKIIDGYSSCMFFKDWAAITRQSDFKPCPQFDGHSFFPLMHDHPAGPYIAPSETQRCVSKMYHFPSTSLVRLKDIVKMNSEVQNPTRVEVATALVHKCLAAVSMKINSGTFKTSVLCHIINLRPPIPVNTITNACQIFVGSIATREDEIQVPNLVAKLRKAKQDFHKLKDMGPDKLVSHALEQFKVASESTSVMKMLDYYECSSFCYFGMYTIDFGWGRPRRVTIARSPHKNQIFFLDDPCGDGINAVITLTEADMSLFQNNKELLDFAAPVIQPVLE